MSPETLGMLRRWALIFGVAFVVGFCVGEARADRVDELHELPIEEACDFRTQLFSDGIIARGRMVEIDDWIESVDQMMKDTVEMYPGATVQEKDFMREHMQFGYDMAQERIDAKIADANEREVGPFKGLVADLPMMEMLDIDWYHEVTNAFYNQCLTEPHGHLTPTNFMKVQSEQLSEADEYYGLEVTIVHALDKLGGWFISCMNSGKGYTRPQCKNEAWNKFFDDTGLHPESKLLDKCLEQDFMENTAYGNKPKPKPRPKFQGV